nr:MAG TPA: hypothetical protein [Bacteriophage sp.]
MDKYGNLILSKLYLSHRISDHRKTECSVLYHTKCHDCSWHKFFGKVNISPFLGKYIFPTFI